MKEVVPAVTVVETQKEKEKVPARELSEEEKQMIMLTEDFQKFMHRGGQIMERALAESVDIYTDYTGLMENEDGRYCGMEARRLTWNRLYINFRLFILSTVVMTNRA